MDSPAPTPPLGLPTRRLRADEVVERVRAATGVQLLDGMGRVVGGRGVVSYHGRGPIASATHLVDAHLIHLDTASELAWETAPVPLDVEGRQVVAVFPMAMGNGSPLPQPGGTFTLLVNEQPSLRFTLSKDSQTWEGGGCRLRFDVRRVDATAFGQALALDHRIPSESVLVDGMAFLLVSPALVTPGEPIRLTVRGESEEPSRSWFRLGRSLFPFLTEHLEPGLGDLLAGRQVTRLGDRSLLLADLHSHSAESLRLDDDGCGIGTRDTMFRFARDVARLDVFSLSEHDWQLGPEDWENLEQLNRKHHEEGSFVTLPSFEWTSATHGHRNVYFRDPGAAVFSSLLPGSPRNTIEEEGPTPMDLWAFLDRMGVPAITVPHHMSVAWFPLSLEHFHDPRYDRVAEIYSCWGDSLMHGEQVSTHAARVPELAFIEAIRAGHRVGFIGSSDAHDGRPGAAQGTASHPHLYHHLGSGRAAILADGFDRHSVFDALHARRCYALTGPRILVDLTMEGHPMGSEIPAARLPEQPTLEVGIETAVPIERIEIFRDGERCDAVWSGRRQERFSWVDPRPPEGPTTSYFLKVSRTDHEAAWTSPIWVRR